MKTFILKVISFLIIVIVIAEILNWGYMRTDPFEVNKFKNVSDNIQICNIGASHSQYAFNYKDVSDQYTTFNFGLPSQSHYYDRTILRYYKDHLAKGGIVFITVSYPMLFGLDETQDSSFESKNRRYYFFLPDEYIREYDVKTDFQCSFIPFLYSNSLKEIILNGIITSKSQNTAYEQVTTKEKAFVDAKEALIRHTVINRVDENGNIIFSEEAENAINDMIVMCKEIGVTPILITPPFTKEYNSIIKEDATKFYNEFYRIIEQICENMGVEYYNYSEDKRFENKYDLFANSDHLNKEGARVFTKIVMEEIVGDRIN